MEPIKDFFSAIRDRIQSPVLGTFVLVWCLLNWKVFGAIFILTDEQVIKLQFANKIDYIANYLKTSNQVWLPLGIAIGYGTLFPFLKGFLQNIVDLAEVLQIKITKRIKGGQMVPMQLFLEHEAKAEEQRKILEELIAKQSIVKSDLDQEKSARIQAMRSITELEEQNKAQKAKLADFESYTSTLPIEGMWSIITPPGETSHAVLSDGEWMIAKDRFQKMVTSPGASPKVSVITLIPISVFGNYSEGGLSVTLKEFRHMAGGDLGATGIIFSVKIIDIRTDKPKVQFDDGSFLWMKRLDQKSK